MNRYEALSRVTGEYSITRADVLFEYARNFSRVWDLELLCRKKALESAKFLLSENFKGSLFLNVNPDIINDENFKTGFTKEFLSTYNIKPGNIIFEITEQNVIKDINSFVLAVDHYKNQNYKIAIDDAGAGYSGLNLISDVNPDYVKLEW